MSDERVRSWAQTLAERETELFDAARKEFRRKASPENLHQLRTASRRLRSLYDDFATVLAEVPTEGLKKLSKRSGEARDAAVLRSILKEAAEDSERELIAPVLRDLRVRERNGTRRASRAVRKVERL